MERKKFFFARFSLAEFYFSSIAPVLMRELMTHGSDVMKKAQQTFYAPLHSMPPRLLLFSFSRYVPWNNRSLHKNSAVTKND
jgi:hypothetical protein